TRTSVVLRTAATPLPSGITVAISSGDGFISSAWYGNSADAAGTVYLARLEASIGNGPFGAVCSEEGFDDVAAGVACRTLGYPSGGVKFEHGAPKGTLTVGVKDPTLDAQGSFLGTLSSVRCSGVEGNFGDCASWRAYL
ncbi:hypothetical protein Vafri_17353, partial [Volvox africanus]